LRRGREEREGGEKRQREHRLKERKGKERTKTNDLID
jgi:hypothetical protein